MIMHGTHDRLLVLLSIIIAIIASFTALSLAGRVRASGGWIRRAWLISAAVALGGGIWSMHFVAMLAFSMPGIEMSYDLKLTFLSLAIALVFTGTGFFVLNWEKISRARTLTAGLLMGTGVLAMHYVGMQAMRMPATLSYEKTWLAISAMVAIGAATAAIWLASRDRKVGHRMLAAAAMGTAISGMHYAGMRAAIFRSHGVVDIAQGEASVGQASLAILISIVTVLILLIALGAARIERVFHGVQRREARTAMRLNIADVLREQNTQEALDKVASLLGRHFNVSRAGYGQLDALENVFDYDVCWTDGTVPPLLGRYPAAAFGVKIVAALSAGETVVVENLFEADLSDEARTRETALEVDTSAILVVPFVRHGRLRTILYLNDKNSRKWHAQDVAFLEEIAERTRLVIERARVEGELRELTTSLEARVEARSKELRQAQEALLQSQKMEAIGQLVSGLAHDFNNVLGAIIGSLELIERRVEDTDRVRRLAAAGLQAAGRGAKLTSQLLTFSRSQSIELQPLYVNALIEEMRDMLSRTLGPLIELDFDFGTESVAVLADPVQLEMMVLNLAINARDAMPGGGTLRISTSVGQVSAFPDLADGVYAEIAVADNGVGMDEATLRRAMEPFFTTKPVGKGTGLGLAQIYGSARQSGGTVYIQSEPNKGATVRVLLPCTDLEPAAHSKPEVVEAQGSCGTAAVLLVDDDDNLRGMIASALDAQGYRVIEASNGNSALSLMADRAPDIAVIDFAMPGMNGGELVRRILEMQPDLPFLIISGFSDIDVILKEFGPSVSLIRKPFHVDEILHALQSHIRER